MNLTLLLVLFAFSTVFILANSFSTERINLFPAAAIFLLIGGTLLTAPGLEIQEGTDLQYTTVNNETVIDQKTPIYTEATIPIQNTDMNQVLGLIFIVMGAGYIVMASPGRFRTILSRR